MSRRPIIAVDFDGTVVEHHFPAVGPNVPGAVDWLKSLSDDVDLVLWTVRTQTGLKDAVRWFETHYVPLAGVNRYAGQEYWAGGPKVYAGLYIDDAALGAPLLQPDTESRPYLDWSVAGPMARDWVNRTMGV